MDTIKEYLTDKIIPTANANNGMIFGSFMIEQLVAPSEIKPKSTLDIWFRSEDDAKKFISELHIPWSKYHSYKIYEFGKRLMNINLLIAPEFSLLDLDVNSVLYSKGKFYYGPNLEYNCDELIEKFRNRTAQRLPFLDNPLSDEIIQYLIYSEGYKMDFRYQVFTPEQKFHFLSLIVKKRQDRLLHRGWTIDS